MITALDVAAAAGVSKTTVSYVFSPDKSSLISEKTRLKVLETAEKLGYQPSYLGRSLSANRSYNVALVLPSRSGHSMSAHMLEIFHSIVRSAENSEYNLSIFLGGGKRLDASLRSRRIDGIIAVGLGADNKLLDHIATYGLPMVVVNRVYPVNQLTGCVRGNMKEWVLNEIAALQQLDCKKILVLNKTTCSDAGREVADALQSMRQEPGSLVNITAETIGENLPHQILDALYPILKYDGFIINGSEGNMLLQMAAQLNIPANRIKVSYFTANNRLDNSGRLWKRCGYSMGEHGWKMLMDMLIRKESGREILLSAVPLQQDLQQDTEIDYGIDI